MSRPPVEVADILRVQGDCFREQNRSWLGYQQLSVLRAIAACRTAALGGHLDSCSRCDLQAISYNSCRNRHCPKCQAQARQRWLARREQDLLPVPYFSFDGQRVSFRWKDYAHGNKQRVMTPSASEFLRRFCQHVLPRVSSASDTSAISPTHAGPLSSRSLASNLLASLRRHRIPPTPRKLPGVVRAAEPTCSSGPTSPRNNWRFDATFPTLPDSNRIQGSRRCDRTSPPTCVFSAKLRPYSPFLACLQLAKLPACEDLSPLLPYPSRVFQPLRPS